MFRGGGGGEGVLPCDVSPTPKKYRFLPLLVSKTYHTLPLYCATVLFFLDTSVRKQPGELLWESTADISLVERLKHGMSSLDENLK